MAQRRNSNQANEPRPSRLRVLVTESYVTNDGEEKTAYHQVGTAFFHKNGHGLNIEFIEGISVSGQVVCLPPPASAGGVDKARQPLPGAAATEGDHHLVVPFTFPGSPRPTGSTPRPSSPDPTRTSGLPKGIVHQNAQSPGSDPGPCRWDSDVGIGGSRRTPNRDEIPRLDVLFLLSSRCRVSSPDRQQACARSVSPARITLAYPTRGSLAARQAAGRGLNAAPARSAESVDPRRAATSWPAARFQHGAALLRVKGTRPGTVARRPLTRLRGGRKAR